MRLIPEGRRAAVEWIATRGQSYARRFNPLVGAVVELFAEVKGAAILLTASFRLAEEQPA